MTECPVCLVEHDEEIHAATVRVRQWFRKQVTIGFRLHRSSTKKGHPPGKWQRDFNLSSFPARQRP
jgi:hypothetical protein